MSAKETGLLPTKPYYAFKKVGVRSLDGSEFFQALADTLEKRRAYYAKALHSTEKMGYARISTSSMSRRWSAIFDSF